MQTKSGNNGSYRDYLIKGKITKYGGTTFRSVLEARWAVFFDYLNIKWEYEPLLFKTYPKWYKPDFYLPDIQNGVIVEVKPSPPTSLEGRLLSQVSDAHGYNAICLCQPNLLFPTMHRQDKQTVSVWYNSPKPPKKNFALHENVLSNESNHKWWFMDMEYELENKSMGWHHNTNILSKAYLAAYYYRFQRGKKIRHETSASPKR